jgi:heme a synthase
VVVVMIVGVTGSLAALGDTLFPPVRWALALAQDFSATSGWLVRWRWTHPTVALWPAFSSSGCWCAQRSDALGQSRALRAGADCCWRRSIRWACWMWCLLAPLWLQVAHLLAPILLWVALVVLTARLTLEPQIYFTSTPAAA